MVSRQKIATQLEDALHGRKPLSIDAYVEIVASHETRLKDSLNDDSDDALLCMVADEGDVALLVVDWDGSTYRNDDGLQKLKQMWGSSFDQNVKTLAPIFAEHINRNNLGVAGIKWMQKNASGEQK
ncbi:MAG: hypothetical protein EAZ11_13395 [Curvibacter sp.]|nr:MAG: hypothetical protein EAZ11_13395 [Curvibacter sp.]